MPRRSDGCYACLDPFLRHRLAPAATLRIPRTIDQARTVAVVVPSRPIVVFSLLNEFRLDAFNGVFKLNILAIETPSL